jgi:protein ImuB
MGRILCAWSPTWAIAGWRRRQPSPSASSPEQDPPPQGEHLAPFALLETVRGTRRLAAVSLEAAQLRLYPGQKATDAFALVPALLTAAAEPEADAHALTELAHWCVRFSPAVAPDPPDGLFLDVAGVAHLWGGEAQMLADFRARLAANGLPFRLTIADTPGAAWALAHFGEDGTIAEPGGQAALLAPLPPAALRLDAETAAQIERLGFRRLGQLMELPRAPLGRRFGAQTLMRLDHALGRLPEALAFRRPPTPWFARLAFAEPISAPEDLARVAVDVSARLCAALEAKDQGARRFELAYHRLDGKALTVTVGLSRAGRDPARLGKLFAPKLETVDPGFGVEVVTLCAHEVEPICARQTRLEPDRQPTDESLSPLVDRLVNRLGEARVWRAAAFESHVPELAATRGKPLAPPAAAPFWAPESPRPVRLFRRPEPVDGVIALTPDDPPTQFRWRGQVHRVRRAEGPERIAEEWWKVEIDAVSVGHVRDYYRVENQDGARFWLFRAGMYEAGQPAKWWLHGVFG